MRPADRFCARCGHAVAVSMDKPPSGEAMRCPTCHATYDPSFRFCATDGSPLTPGYRLSWWRTAQLSFARIEWWKRVGRLIPDEASRNGWSAALVRFLSRYRMLLLVTLVAAIVALLFWPVGAVLAVPPVLAGWTVALSRSEGGLRRVRQMDEWFLRAYDNIRNGGRIRRWGLRPLFSLTDNWNAFSAREADAHIFAALRVFGYIALSLAVIALTVLILYVAVVIMLTLLLFGFAFWILQQIFDIPSTPRGRVLGGDPLMGGGRRGNNLHRGKGGWFGQEEKAGRVDQYGNILKGRGGLFGQEQKIGRVDADGTIFEGEGGFFGTEEKVGRRDRNGDIMEGKGGLFGTEEKIGRIDRGGTIYRGKGGWFDHEEKVGRTD